MITLVPAAAWGCHDRGLLREGFVADINVFDPDTVGPEMPDVEHDLPGGARRLVQKAPGFKATVVNGEVLIRDGEHTGAYPGSCCADLSPLRADRAVERDVPRGRPARTRTAFPIVPSAFVHLPGGQMR